MSEIIFRGKAINRDIGYHRTSYKNGDWVYGLVTRIYDERFELPVEMTDINGVSGIEVDYKTIGQCTGSKDKNGKKIFEGDIVKTQPFYDRPYSDKRKSKEFIGVVKYKTRIFNGNKYYSKQCYCGEWGLEFNEDFGKYTEYSWGELWNCEVIGNIYDNKEILDVK